MIYYFYDFYYLIKLVHKQKHLSLFHTKSEWPQILVLL